MVRRPKPEPLASIRRRRRPRDVSPDVALERPESAAPSVEATAATPGPSDDVARPAGTLPPALGLDGLTVAGFTRRRAAFLAGAFVTIWIVAVFARQVGDASAATAKADSMRADNATASAQVSALQAELEQIQQAPFIAQQARAYDLGAPNERAFTLGPGASPLPSNAPGSAAVRLGGHATARSPLDTWLALLFGPAPR